MAKKVDLVVYQNPSDAFRSETASLIIGEQSRESLIVACKKIEAAVANAEAFEITQKSDALGLNNMLAAAKLAGGLLEADRVKRKEPILVQGRNLDALYKPAEEALARLEKVIKRKLNDYLQAEQLKAAIALKAADDARKAAEAKAAEAKREAEQAKSLEESKAAEAKKLEAEKERIEANRAVPTELFPDRIVSSLGKTTTRKVVVAALEDVKKVPREYLEAAVEADPAKLIAIVKKAYNAGILHIDGMKIEEETGLTTTPGTS